MKSKYTIFIQEVFSKLLKKERIDFEKLPKLLTVKQVSRILNVHPNTLRNWDSEGRLRASRMGSRKDRRYEKEIIRQLYHKSPSKAQLSKRMVIYQWVRSYILRLRLVPRFFYLLFRLAFPKNSKKKTPQQMLRYTRRISLLYRYRSMAVYTGVVVVICLLIVVQFMPIYKIFSASAEETATKNLRLEPKNCEGWFQSDEAKHIDALPSTPVDEFLEQNSSLISNQQVFSRDPLDGAEKSADASESIVCSGFTVNETFPEGTRLEDPKVLFSFAADTYPADEDVVRFSYSLDGSVWKSLESFALTDDISNATHGGYWYFPLPDVKTVADLQNAKIRVTYNPVPSTYGSRVFFDGAAIDVTFRKPPPENIAKKIRESIALTRLNVTGSQDPQFEIDVEDKSSLRFLGVKPTTRAVKSIKVTDAEGFVKDVPIKMTRGIEDGEQKATYAISRSQLLHPGKYIVTLEVEQSGYIESVRREFTWGVIAMNLRETTPPPDTHTELHLSVLDDLGKTQCDAQLEVTIKHPGDFKETFSTKDGSIVRNPDCRDQSVTHDPDYSIFFTTTREGNYEVEATATIATGTRTITDGFSVAQQEPFTIVREKFPTRIYPVASYETEIRITPHADFTGIISEKVPTSFTLENITNGGSEIIGDADTYYKTIEWLVSWKQGETYTIGYLFKSPEKVPEFYQLGPLQIGEFQESRSWQIASDSVGTASFTRLWSSGFELQTSTANEEFTAVVGTTPTIDTSSERSGVAALQTNESAATSGITYQYSNANSANDYYFRAYLYVTDLPETTVNIMDYYDSGNTVQASIRMTSGGVLQLWNDEDSAQQTGTFSSIATSTWYRLEFRYDATTIASTYLEARVDGVTFSSGTVNHANGGNRIRVGTLTTDTGGASTMYWDDLAINSDDAGITSSIPENWPGPGKIVHLMPNEQPSGASSDTCGGSATSWQAVDERGSGGPDDATTIVTCDNDAGTDFLEVTLEDSGSQGINANDRILLTQPGIRYTRASAANGTLNLQVKIPSGNSADQSSAITDSATAYTTNGNAAPRTYKQTSYGDQTGATDFDVMTPTDVDDALLRVTATDANPDARVSTLWLLVEYEPAEGGRLWSSGFEMQSVTAGEEWATITNAPTINTTASYFRSGAASLRINGFSSGAAEAVAQDFVAANANGPYYARAYVRIETAPSANNRIMSFRDSGGTDRAFIVMTSTGALELHDEDSGGTAIGTSTALSVGAWYRLELQINASGAGATDTVEGRINGTNFGSSTTRNLTNGVTTIVLGGNLNAESQTQGDWYFDDVAVNKNAGSTQNGYPGAGSIVHLRPNAAGDNSGFTNDYTYVDEENPDDASSYMYTATGNAISDVRLFDSSTQGISASDPISLVSVGLRGNIGNTTAMPVSARLKDSDNGTVIEGDKANFTTTTWLSHSPTQPRIYGLTAYTRPQQASAWNATTLDSAQIGIRNLFTSNVISPEQLQVTTLWMLVEYIPSTINIYGKVYANETPTAYDCSANTITVRASVNGSVTEQTNDCTLSSGSFTIAATRPSNAADPVAVFIDSGESIKGTTVTLAADTTTDIYDLFIYQDRMAVRHEDAGPMTNAKLATGDNGNAGIRYAVASSNLTVESGIELHVWTGDTYTPGGTVTTNATGGNMHVDDGATANLNTAGNAIGLDLQVDGGANVTISGDTTIAGGDITTAGTSAVVTFSGTPTVTMTGTGNIGGGTTPTISFYNLTIGTATTAVTTITNNVSVSNTLNIDTSDTLTIDSGRVVSHTGTTFTFNGTLNGAGKLSYRTTTAFPTSGTIGGTVTIIFDSSGITQTLSARTDYQHVEMINGSPDTGGTTRFAAGTITINGNVTTSITDVGLTVDLNTNDPTVTIYGAVTNGVAVTFSASNTSTLFLRGNYTNNGTFSHNNGNVTLSGTAVQAMNATMTGVGHKFYNLTVTNVSSGGIDFNASAETENTYTITTSGVKVTYEAGATFTFQNINWAGTSGVGNSVTFVSSAASQWNLVVSGTQTDVSYVNVAYSNACGGNSISAANGTNTDSLNNSCWNFTAMSVTGTANGNNGATVRIAYNNTLQGQTTTISGGNWTISGLSTPGTDAIITAWVDNVADANESTAVLKYDNSGVITAMVLNTNVLSIGGGDNTSVSIANLGLYDNDDDEDIMHASNSGTVTVDADNVYTSEKLDITTGDTLTVGNTDVVSTLDWDVNGTVTATGNATFNVAGSISMPGTFTAGTSTITMSGTSKTLSATGKQLYNLTISFSGDVSISSGTHEIMNNFHIDGGTFSSTPATLTIGQSFTNDGTFDANNGSVYFNKAGGTIDGTSDTTFYDLYINPNTAGAVTLQTSSLVVTNLMEVSASDTLSIGSGLTVTHTGGTYTLSGTVSGDGYMIFTNTSPGPGTSGTLSAITRYDASSGDIASTTVDARTYGAAVEFYSNNLNPRSATFASGTYTLSGTSAHFYVYADGIGDMSVNGATNNPTVNIGGNFDILGTGGGTEPVSSGSGTWTISGNFDATCNTFLATYCFTASTGNTVIMNGTSKTLTAYTGGSTLYNFTASGTISIVERLTVTHALTISGSLTPATGTSFPTLTLGGAFINNGTYTHNSGKTSFTGTAGTIDGSSNTTFYDLTIDPSSTGTVTLQTSNITVTNTMAVAADDALSISSGLTVTHTGATYTLSGTVSGAGTMTFTNTSSGPGTSGTLSSITRYDATAANIASTTLDARTYNGQVELYSASASSRSLTLASGTYTLSGASSHFVVYENGDDVLTVTGVTNNPTVTIGGNLDFLGTAGVVVTGTGVWTVSGNADFTAGTYTASTNNTLKMNGTSKTLTAAGNELQKFEVSGGSVATADTVLVNKTFDITGGGFTQAANANLTVYGHFTIANGTTFTAASGSGILIMDGNPDPMTFTDSTSPKQDMGNVQIGLSPGTTDLGSDFTAKSVVVASGDTFNTNGYDMDIGTGGITIAGTLDATDDVETDTTMMDTDGKFDLQSGGTFTPSDSTITFTISPLVVTNVTNDFMTVGSGDPYNVVVNDGGGTYTLTVEVEDPVVVTNNVTITGGVLDAKSGENNAISVGNNWTNNDSFVPRSGTVTFTATDTGNTIGGTMGDLDDFYDLVFNGSGGEWTTNTAMIVGNDLTVTAGSLLGTTDITLYGTLAGGGTVTRTGGTFLQRVAAAENFGSTANAADWTFTHLNFETSSGTDRTITFASGGSGQVIISGTLTIGNTGDTNVTTIDNETNDRIINANGAVTITSKGLLSASSTASFTVAGDWTNNGDFTDNSGTVTLDGGAQQTLSGQMTGASDRFNNLTITNVSGSNPESSPSVIFAAAADTANNFRAETANTKLRFSASATYTFQNIFFNGQATNTRVYLRSSTGGTQWNINVAGTRTVSNTDVKDSNACGQAPDIDASDGTNRDSINNTCWIINSLTFAISDTTIGFGALTTANARFATADTNGANYSPAVSAHTMSVATSAPSGYAITYNGPTLTSGGNTISAATITGDEDGTPGSAEQFAMSFSTSGNATIAATYAKASNNYNFNPSTTTTIVSETGTTPTETISCYYLANITPVTEPGSYLSDITYIATGTF